MQYVANINRVSKPNHYSWTKIMIPNAESMDTVIAELGNEHGKSFKVTIKDAIEVYAMWAAGRLNNSEDEVAYIKEHHKQLPAYSL